jgi:hypothetical protein
MSPVPHLCKNAKVGHPPTVLERDGKTGREGAGHPSSLRYCVMKEQGRASRPTRRSEESYPLLAVL